MLYRQRQLVRQQVLAELAICNTNLTIRCRRSVAIVGFILPIRLWTILHATAKSLFSISPQEAGWTWKPAYSGLVSDLYFFSISKAIEYKIICDFLYFFVYFQLALKTKLSFRYSIHRIRDITVWPVAMPRLEMEYIVHSWSIDYWRPLQGRNMLEIHFLFQVDFYFDFGLSSRDSATN